MRTRTFSVALVLVACSSEESAPISKSEEPFTSIDAVLLELDLTGALTTTTSDEDEVHRLVAAQLAYTVGPLNAESAAGDLSQIAISDVQATPRNGMYHVTYRAKLPVAWAGSSIPTTYDFALPARVGADAESAFASKYGTSCVEEDASGVDRFRMFFEYRPQRATCKLDPADVAMVSASVTRAPVDPTPRYPEYQRIWEDGALNVIALFTRADNGPDDDGVRAYDRFVADAAGYLRRLQPRDTKWITSDGELDAVLPDGRSVHIASKLVGHHLADDGAELDAWYDAHTPDADLVLYNGHAGLGGNVRELMQKGQFRPHQYLLLALNGCDTFSYADATLAMRRAALNPDDPKGTKYLDTVLNVLPGNFATTANTTMTFIEAAVEARDTPPRPRSYAEILGLIASQPVVVVTGEEDNEFQPGMLDVSDAGVAPLEVTPDAVRPRADAAPRARSSCATARGSGDASALALVLVAIVLSAARRCRRPPAPRAARAGYDRARAARRRPLRSRARPHPRPRSSRSRACHT
jgi:hypothetical protein